MINPYLTLEAKVILTGLLATCCIEKTNTFSGYQPLNAPPWSCVNVQTTFNYSWQLWRMLMEYCGFISSVWGNHQRTVCRPLHQNSGKKTWFFLVVVVGWVAGRSHTFWEWCVHRVADNKCSFTLRSRSGSAALLKSDTLNKTLCVF